MLGINLGHGIAGAHAAEQALGDFEGQGRGLLGQLAARFHINGQQCAAPASALGLNHGLRQAIQQQAPVG